MESIEILYGAEMRRMTGRQNACKTRVHAETHVNMNGIAPVYYLHAEHT